MADGIIIDPADIKKIIAEKYGVDEKDVLKIQYSYVVKVKKDG